MLQSRLKIQNQAFLWYCFKRTLLIPNWGEIHEYPQVPDCHPEAPGQAGRRIQKEPQETPEGQMRSLAPGKEKPLATGLTSWAAALQEGTWGSW